MDQNRNFEQFESDLKLQFDKWSWPKVQFQREIAILDQIQIVQNCDFWSISKTIRMDQN